MNIYFFFQWTYLLIVVSTAPISSRIRCSLNLLNIVEISDEVIQFCHRQADNINTSNTRYYDDVLRKCFYIEANLIESVHFVDNFCWWLGIFGLRRGSSETASGGWIYKLVMTYTLLPFYVIKSAVSFDNSKFSCQKY